MPPSPLVNSSTQLLVGMAAGGVVAGPARPAALLAGAVAGLLPDLIDWWERRVFRQPAITVVPDPLARQPAQIPAQGMREAMRLVWRTGAPCVVRLHPMPDCKGGRASYCLDLSPTRMCAMPVRRSPGQAGPLVAQRERQLFASAAPGGRAVGVFPPETGSAALLTPFHPLPLAIHEIPVDLLLSPAGRRIECRDLGRVAGVGHSLPAIGVLCAIACAWGPWMGIAAAAALAAHVLLDLGGRCDWSPWAPLDARTWPGRRLWDEQGRRANLVAALLAAGIVLAVIYAGRA